MSPQTKLEIIHELIEHFFGAPPNPPVAMHNQATAPPITRREEELEMKYRELSKKIADIKRAMDLMPE